MKYHWYIITQIFQFVSLISKFKMAFYLVWVHCTCTSIFHIRNFVVLNLLIYLYVSIPFPSTSSRIDRCHYNDVKMSALASQITSLTVVYSTVSSAADQRKHQSSASLAFVRGIHRRPVNSSHKWPVTRRMFPFDDVIMAVRGIRYVELIRKTNATWQRYDRINLPQLVGTELSHQKN